MYRCEFCHKIVGPRIALVRKVVETRAVLYPHRINANLFYRDGKLAKSHDRGGSGHQIVREMKACAGCEMSGATSLQGLFERDPTHS